MILRDFILEGKAALEAAKLECADPLLHMKQIVEAALGIDTAKLYLRWESPITDSEIEKVENLLARRLTGEPFQYIVGYEDFWKHRFRVGPGALIPRRETEVLLEVLLKEAPPGPLKLAELGPGTGIIGLSALLERPDWKWYAFEKNPDSMPYVTANRDVLLPRQDRFHLFPGDFFSEASRHAPYDWLVSNPPYVATGELPTLSREVRHEPPVALDGGPRGLDIVRRIAETAKRLLKPGGWVLLEIGSDQEREVQALFDDEGYVGTRIVRDYAGLPRVVLSQLG